MLRRLSGKMKYLLVKMRRELLNLWPQFISVFLMALLSVTIFTGMEGVWTGMELTTKKYYNETNLCDIWAYGTFTDNDKIDECKKIPEIKGITSSMNVVVNCDLVNDSTDIKLISIEDNSTLKPKTLSGKNFTTNKNGIFLDNEYAVKNGISVGDKINIEYNNLTYSIKVAALIMNSEFIYYTGSSTESIPNPQLHGYGFVSDSQMKKIFGKVIYNELRINVNNKNNVEDICKKVKSVYNDSLFITLVRDDHKSIVQTNNEIGQAKRMAIMFAAVFILLALLTMYTTMSRIVKHQMIQIGTMKAIGYSDFKISLYYLSYGLTIPLVGGLLGLILGRLTVSNAVINVKKTTLVLPEWNIINSWVSYLIIVIIVIICVLSTFIATFKSLRGMPAETMRGIDPNEKNKKLAKRSNRQILSYEFKLVLHDALRNKIRYIIGVVGVLGSITLMMAGFGISDSINYANDYVFSKQFSYINKAVLTNYNQDIRDKIINYDNKAQFLYEMSVDIKNNDLIKNGIITVLDSGNYVNIENKQKIQIDLPDTGIVITNKLAKELKISKSDEVEICISGNDENYKVKIKEITVALSPQGIYMSNKAYESLNKNFIPNAILLGNIDRDEMNEEEYIKEVTPIAKQISNTNDLTKSVNTIIILLIAASIMLSFVILYNLGMLNFSERYREYATMKVLGFSKAKIGGILVRECILTTVPGVILGIPAGFIFLKFYINIVSFDNYEWLARLDLLHLILIPLAIILCSLLIHIWINHKVNKIKMTEALKSFE